MNQIYCSNCGKLINLQSNYCKFCGAPQHGREAMFRAQDPAVNKPQSVTNIPKQARRKTMEYIPKRHLGGDAITYFVIRIFGRSFILFLLLLIGAIFMPWPFALSLVVYIVGLIIVSLLVYNNFTFEVDSDGLKIEQGIIHRLHVSVPYEQIQNVNIERSITDRVLGLSKISIETAGQASTPTNGNITKSRAEAYLPGLRLKVAETVHDLLIDGADGEHGN